VTKMTIYKSDKAINEIQDELGIKFTAANRAKIQRILRTYFVNIHREACKETRIAKNKREYIEPNFTD